MVERHVVGEPSGQIIAAASNNIYDNTGTRGEPSGQIIAAASQHGCDLVVLGTHGHTALGNLFMGSVAMRVIADSPIPILMVK